MRAGLGIWRPDRPEHQAGVRDSIQLEHVENMIRRAGRWEPTLRALPPTDEEAISTGSVPSSLGGSENPNPVRSWQFRFSDDVRHTFVEGDDGCIYYREDEPEGRQWRSVCFPSSVTGEPEVDHWSLERFGDAVYAVGPGLIYRRWNPDNYLFDVIGSGQGTDENTYPNGAYVMKAVRDFMVAANFGEDGAQTVRWSALNQPARWPLNGDDSSGSQVLADMGAIRDIVVFEDAFLLCANGIVRMTLTGGPEVFQFDVVSREFGCEAYGLAVGVEHVIYYASTDGFIAFHPHGGVRRIGLGLVDTSYRGLIDELAINRAFTYYDLNTHAIYWSFAGNQVFFPDTTLIYSLESQSWGLDRPPNAVTFLEAQPPLNLLTVPTRFGVSTFAEFAAQGFTTFIDRRFSGSGDILHGFDEDRKAGPLLLPAEASCITNVFSPLADHQRFLVTGVRPWTNGDTPISIRMSEQPHERGQNEFIDCEPKRAEGNCPVFASGRYAQLRFRFPTNQQNLWLTGCEVEWQMDGLQ